MLHRSVLRALTLASSCLILVVVDATPCNAAADCAAGETCQCTQSTTTRRARQLHTPSAKPRQGNARTMSLKPASGDGPKFAQWKQRMQEIFHTDTLTADQYNSYRNARHSGRRLFGVSASCGTCVPLAPSASPPPPPLPPPLPSPPPSPPPPPFHCTSCCWSGSTAGTQVTIRTNGEPTSRVWLSTNHDGSNVDLWSQVTGNQQWRIYDHGSYATIRTNGEPTSRVWLSTTADGSNVDLWSQVTGNQQWVIYDYGSYATIRTNGEPTSRVWLSTTADGSNVDLWSQVTGNQQWTISCTA